MLSINSLFILAVSLALSWLANWAFRTVIPRLTKKTKTETDDRIIAAVKFPTTIMIIAGAVLLVLSPYVEQTKFIYYFNNGTITLLILLWSVTIGRVVNVILDEVNHRISSHHDIIPFFKSLNSILAVGIGLVIILIIWKIDVTPLLAAGGVVGIAVAFAAKDTIANIFGGISVFIDRPFKVGDYILIDGTERGEVISIGARTTKLKTRDDVLITIPNSILSTSKIVNETGLRPPLRIRVMVGMPYGCDLEKAEKTLFLSISSVEEILDDPAPRVRFREFADSSINAEVMGWVEKPVQKGRVTHKLIKQIHRDLKKAKIMVPFPQRDVHLKRS